MLDGEWGTQYKYMEGSYSTFHIVLVSGLALLGFCCAILTYFYLLLKVAISFHKDLFVLFINHGAPFSHFRVCQKYIEDIAFGMPSTEPLQNIHIGGTN